MKNQSLSPTSPDQPKAGSLAAGGPPGSSAGDVARDIHQRDDVTRWLLEAWILSGAAARTIAGKVGVKVKVVAAYEELFLDIRDQRQATDLMMITIAGLQSDRRPDFLETVQRHAFFGGPLVLEKLLEALGGPEGLSSMTLPACDLSTPEGRMAAQIQLTIGIEVLDIGQLSPQAQLELISWSVSAGQDRKSRPVRSGTDAIWQAMAEKLPTSETLEAGLRALNQLWQKMQRAA
ncbi:MAG: hypothetical protein RIC12_00985 [Pirellulales bacterium]